MSRAKRAVMVSLSKTGEDKIRITLDDLVQTDDTPSKWNKDGLITFKDLDITEFEALDFSERELADFGYAVIARLYAFATHGDV